MLDTTPVAVEEPSPLQDPQDSYFYDGLAPYGNWVQTGDGWGWQPMAAAVDSGWLPYRDRGHWVLTDDGWYWASDYAWGWAVFHYGRWSHESRLGWVWVPGNVWAPAWVAWRNTQGFAGWAALPPGVQFQPGVGLVGRAGLGGWKVSYGLNAASFTFVAQEHFLARNLGRFAAPAPQAAALFKSSTPVNNYSSPGRRIVNSGVSAAQIAAATKSPVPKFAMKDASSPSDTGVKSVTQSLDVFRPNLAATAVRSSAEAPARPVLINKTPRPALAQADYSSQASRSSPAASSARPGLTSGNFQSPVVRPTPSSPAPAVSAAGLSPLTSLGDVRRTPSPSASAPAAGYPSYSPRGLNSTPLAVPGTAPTLNPPQRNVPAAIAPVSTLPNNPPAGGASVSAPPHNPPAASGPASAPAESRGGGGQASQGSGSSSSSSASSSTSKTTK
jgi:hypothetical protein